MGTKQGERSSEQEMMEEGCSSLSVSNNNILAQTRTEVVPSKKGDENELATELRRFIKQTDLGEDQTFSL
jgi:hypothetical protein